MNRIIAITLTDINNDTDKIVASLKSLPSKPAVRVVFDEKDVGPRDYVAALKAIRPYVSLIVGEILDSYYIKNFSRESHLKRVKLWYATLKGLVDVWEIANEANGEWTKWSKGDNLMKIVDAWAYLNSCGERMMLTLYQDEKETWTNLLAACDRDGHLTIPQAMRDTIEFVTMSSYPHDNSDFEGNWNSIFDRLGRIFKKAKLGVGECGMDPEEFKDRDRVKTFRHVYNDVFAQVTHERFVGFGGFWYDQDVVPPGSLLHSDLAWVLT